MAKSSLPLCIAILIYSSHFSNSAHGRNCSKTNSSLLNYESQFEMVQHQLRGVFKKIDDCSFKVTEFDMLKGSNVHWWGAMGYDFTNLTNGFVISNHKLNHTYKNDSFVVKLLNNISWDQIKVVSIWDKPTASDFGHVVLTNINKANKSSSSLDNFSPSPSPSPSSIPTKSTTNASFWIHEKPTIFDNCKTLSKNYRVRWTLKGDDNLIDIGLEAAIGIQNYMAFGWAKSNSSSKLMLGADVAVAGFTDTGMPFVDDYYITKYSECMINKDGEIQGVCPDTMYNSSDPDGFVNNTRLAYGHRKDGVLFIRYQRPLKSVDKRYDLQVNISANMNVIWAMGSIKPPDTLQPYYLPQNHGKTYGHLRLNVSHHVNDCFGPLDAKDKEDQDVIIADKNDSIIVTTGPALYYPNPPNPARVLYINRKQAPVLRVERGVKVKFSIQAGHDVAFYITSDPLGGNVTKRNESETVYVGGPEAEGVKSSPMELIWAPNRNTPDQVYYQSLYTQKMGWKVQVVDGGLPDMYNNSVVLDDQQVTFFWTLSEKSISIAAQGEKKSGYLAIGFGSGMVNSYAYVGWFDANETGRVNTYYIDGKEASNIHQTKENLTYMRCKKENGVITFEFTRPLNPFCDPEEKPECNNIIEPTTPLKVIWAMGAKWALHNLSEKNMHFVTSKKPVRILLMSGSAEAEEDLRPVLAVHGFMMFLAWGILLPSGVLSARYLKHIKGDKWFQIHVYLQYSGLAIIFLGFLFAVAELRGFYIKSLHVKVGVTAIILACLQPVNAYLRPKRPEEEEEEEAASLKRVVWEYIHVIIGRSAIFVGVVGLVSGMKHLGDRYDGENVMGLTWAMIIWFLICALTVLYLENREKKKRRRRERVYGRGNWALGEEDENLDLLSPSRMLADKRPHPSEKLEIQLESLNR